ncbi:UdgX family uracil-DNA binding protein [Streptomyces griseocarneus]|uniref:UdgX family uracil-DNA binding protein n=1 Tax=Streptomyces griseocarneus TaxID=51201 RepID=UPI0019A5B63C|nr:UdgX family uracil-DNA binding protein [Streptomyces griseocarneus]MBZ6477792.1 UdgX family uracil-DNA binding protein [Streptomyces griseocarneus]GHG61040.1 uracil-DNA glycosylase [Streptomyces griseocarneus]
MGDAVSGGARGTGSAYDAGPFVPSGAGLGALREAAAGCRGCPLFREATQTVFGAGEPSARVVLVGEQPGDQEDRQGRPFVGPAGGVLMRALDEAGIDPADAYITNAVKHFKFEQAARGKRRIHKAPGLREIGACRPWLAAELRLLDPEVVVALGATAGKSLMGPSFRVTRERGVALPMPSLDGGGNGEADGDGGGEGLLVATIHPSAVLRSDPAAREEAYAGLVSDLRVAAGLLG